MKKDLYFINPIAHFVYQWWFFLLSKMRILHICNESDNEEKYGDHCKLIRRQGWWTKSNPIINYKKPVQYNANDIFIIGDIFVNLLSFQYRWRNVVYYSEFFDNGKTWEKKMFFYIIWWLFFYNKKIIVPTTQAYKTFQKISNNVYYLPQLWEGDIRAIKYINQKPWLKFLFVGRISEYFKNISFMIDGIISIQKKHPNVSLTLVGRDYDNIIQDKYQSYFKSWILRHISFVSWDELLDIYDDHSTLLLCSNSDPIWSVIMEAMARWLSIIVSDTVWASSYVEDDKNGYIFKNNDMRDYIWCLEKTITHPNIQQLQLHSLSLVCEKYDIRNIRVKTDYISSLWEFIYK
jgi:glycosyltransferase involved in cell wall biosynthesis